MKRTRIYFASAAVLALGACQSVPVPSAPEREFAAAPACELADIIIAGGELYHGSGTPGRAHDIAIRGDRIVYVGADAARHFRAEIVIDAAGLVVAPGFIDPHTHAGSDLAAQDQTRRANLPFAFQGATTVMTGNDGFGDYDIAAMAQSAQTAVPRWALEGDARIASFNMNPADIAAFASQDWVVTGSDGSNGHPRKYGSFPKAYRDLVLGSANMDLARFIQRSSGQTADIIGIEARDYLKEGYFADVLIFDPERFGPGATYSAPREFSTGVTHLIVDGEAMIRDETYTGALSGRPLLKDAQC